LHQAAFHLRYGFALCVQRFDKKAFFPFLKGGYQLPKFSAAIRIGGQVFEKELQASPTNHLIRDCGIPAAKINGFNPSFAGFKNLTGESLHLELDESAADGTDNGAVPPDEHF
jgi:hypothetical protein